MANGFFWYLNNKAKLNSIVSTLGDYYVKCESADAGALLVVASGATTGQVNLAGVTPRMDTYIPTAGDYVTKAVNLLKSKADVKQEDWITPTLTNGFTSGTLLTIAYYKDTLGVVHIQGGATNGSVGAVIFTLPAGYRPSMTIKCYVSGDSSSIAIVQVTSDGIVTLIARGGLLAYLNEVMFRAA